MDSVDKGSQSERRGEGRRGEKDRAAAYLLVNDIGGSASIRMTFL
jgi:hypothetical protein